MGISVYPTGTISIYGSVTGPTVSTPDGVPVWANTGGKVLVDTPVTIDPATGNLVTPGTASLGVTTVTSLTSANPLGVLVGSNLLTVDGGLAVQLVNKTGGATVKGHVVEPGASVAGSVIKIQKDIPDPIGILFESGIADGELTWVVVTGIAYVYFVGNVALGQLARGFLTADGASYVTGQALAENFPTAPFASDRHFFEVGHTIEARTGAGLAKCVLHFN